MAAELGQQTVDFSTLVSRAAEESFLSLRELVEKSNSSEQSDAEKKINLLKYLFRTQQRMLKLNVLAKWCQQAPLIQYCQQLTSTLSSHDACFTQAADSLFFMHEGLQQARAPAYDVPSATQVLLTGNYQRLPKCIEDVGSQGVLDQEEQKPVIKKLDTLVRSKLLEVSIPKEVSSVKVSDGTVLLIVDGEFKVLVTLGYRGHLSLWRILHLELLVGEKGRPIKLEESRRHVLGDDLERRMAAAENPFLTLYSVLHELCVALTMDTVIRQVQVLRLGRWKDTIRFDLIMDGSASLPGSSSSQLNQEEADSASLRTPGLKIIYWLDSGKGSTVSDCTSCPYIKIEPGQDLQIKSLHSTFVVDPSNGKEAEFSLDQKCIDVEKLLLRAIFCNRYTRLLEIQKELCKNVQIYRSVDDVKLQPLVGQLNVDYRKDDKINTMEYEGQEVLCVRAYGSSFFGLGINIRNGRFLLQSSKNILPPSVLSECEEALNQGSMSAAEVFIRLRTKSILNLFSSMGRFLGLQVYEDNSAAIRIPESISNDSTMLLLGFPDCGSSYFLLMQLDKEFKPQFKLLEISKDSSGKSPSSGNLNNVTCIKKIDMDKMQLPEDELDFGLLDWGKLQNFLPNSEGLNQHAEHDLLSDVDIEVSGQATFNTISSFSSIVDEVFDLEKGVSVPPFSAQSFTTSFSASATQYGSLTAALPSVKAGSPSPKWEGGVQMSQVNRVPAGGQLYLPSNLRGPLLPGTSISSVSGRATMMKRISASKSDQDLASLRSPQSVEVSSCASVEEDQTRFLSDSTKDALPAGRSYQMLSPPGAASSRVPAPGGKFGGSKTTPNGPLAVPADSAISLMESQEITSKGDKNLKKRKVADMLSLIPSLQGLEENMVARRRRKISGLTSPLSHQSSSHMLVPLESVRTSGYSYGNLLAEANKGNVPSSAYILSLLHVVRHCSLCIKHARLTSQMVALDIPYVDEVGVRDASSNIWFRLPFTRGDSWQYICLRLGRPGTMSWDVKINDPYFRDIWELQKGLGSTPWGSGVRIANMPDMDSHIRCDAEGVVLVYQSVEADSIKKLVADIQRLCNARMFALGMRKLLGVKADDKQEDNTNSDGKSPVGSKCAAETSDKFSDQMRKVFRIEAVGLMSLWFSFSPVVLARFVVEWESGKEGCTMHVSPDQLWPHTKFLEDFINGGEVVSLLDCIRLTVGPLHSLAAATRPARATPSAAGPGVTAAMTSMSRQGLLPGNVSSNLSQSTSTPAGNAMLSSGTAPPGIHNLHGAAMLPGAGRGGPGIVPSSLLPIDVSIVLRGPYWIRIVYRKNFSVDMRCFAGDQVWLQPATPPKGGPSVGGSLPCPQFRPFIMEHVAQELNGLEPSFSGVQQTTGPANMNSPNMGSGAQLSMVNSNSTRVNLGASAAAVSRAATQVSSLSRVGTALLGSPSLGAGGSALPIRRSLGTGVSPHARGDLNTAIIGLGDDGGYGGGWVPLVALKKVLRGILKYLGVLWLFAQLPDLLKDILGSILKESEGALLSLDQEQPALRFFVGGYVFAVSVHRVQLLLQVLSVKRFHHQQQQQQSSVQEELTQAEIGEICDYFSRRVASEPYDASRVASFITLLTLPISVLREFLKLIAWKKGLAQAQGGDIAPTQKPRIELCLESHSGVGSSSENSSLSKSNIHYDKTRGLVDFALTVVLDPAYIPHINAAGGAAWLPYCVSVRLRYSFMETTSVSFLGMEGSHGGRAYWSRSDEWERCKQRVARAVEGLPSAGDGTQGRLKGVADNVQRTLHLCLQALRDGGGATASSGPT
ncbi:hypothetical protein SAY86_013777 [Trapa natans]|uniref:Mediator of RNA polymerase II transcription subunit 14 n=1 Tax=Trapa natans TaxID=22666 RepID=A0AAN7KRL1_TRANT|nr:hypothetical protein SAY86_013777 [Trapa natans]